METFSNVRNQKTHDEHNQQKSGERHLSFRLNRLEAGDEALTTSQRLLGAVEKTYHFFDLNQKPRHA